MHVSEDARGRVGTQTTTAVYPMPATIVTRAGGQRQTRRRSVCTTPPRNMMSSAQ